jgi:PAS domain S-box-containing protein
MTVPASLQTALLRFISPILPLWHLLVEPSAKLLDPALRRQSRLLNYLLLPIFASLVVLANWSGSSSGYLAYVLFNLAIVIAVYLLNHEGYYLAAASVVCVLVSGSAFLNFMLREQYQLITPEFALFRVMPAVLIAHLLLPLRGMLLVSVVNLLSVGIIGLVARGMYPFLFTVFFFTIITTALTAISAVWRKHSLDQIEQQANALRESEARFRSMLEASFETLMLYQDNRIIDINSAVEPLLGYTAQEMIGRSVIDFVEPPYEAQFQNGDPAQSSAPFHILLRRKNGSALRAEVRSKWLWHKGQSIRAIAVRDITELKNQEELNIEREKVSVLQKFIGNLSHDLRTPLSVINTSIYLINKLEQDPERQHHQIDVLRSQAAHMQRLLEDLISMARLDKADTSAFNFRWVNLNEPISQAISEHQNMALRKNQTLTYQFAPNLPKTLVDVNEFKLAIKHLILNGLSYTGEGGIVSVETSVDPTHVIVQVRDTGVGIEPDHMPHIFEHFYRADEARGDEGGTGVGLTIAKKIVEAHGGTIRVESQPNQGSIFSIFLPIQLH